MSGVARLTAAMTVSLAIGASIACGGGGPSGPRTANMAGVWTGTGTLSAATGNTCVTQVFRSAIGNRLNMTLSVNQNGTQIAATANIQGSGASCQFDGTVGENSFALNATSCTAGQPVRVTCSNGAVGFLVGNSAAITGNVSGNQLTGTYTETDTVLDVFGNPAGTLNLTLTLNLSR